MIGVLCVSIVIFYMKRPYSIIYYMSTYVQPFTDVNTCI